MYQEGAGWGLVKFCLSIHITNARRGSAAASRVLSPAA